MDRTEDIKHLINCVKLIDDSASLDRLLIHYQELVKKEREKDRIERNDDYIDWINKEITLCQNEIKRLNANYSYELSQLK